VDWNIRLFFTGQQQKLTYQYIISKKKQIKTQYIHNRHQHNTDDGGQAMGEESIHVQMSRWSKRAAIRVMRQSNAFQHNISLQKQVALAENKVYTLKSWRARNSPTDHSGVGFMGELFPTRCMVSPNQVEETRVWTD